MIDESASLALIKSLTSNNPVGILYKSIMGRYRPVSYPDGPITARYRFIKNASWEGCFCVLTFSFTHILKITGEPGQICL